jgi:hypothetical protein
MIIYNILSTIYILHQLHMNCVQHYLNDYMNYIRFFKFLSEVDSLFGDLIIILQSYNLISIMVLPINRVHLEKYTYNFRVPLIGIII